jgi:DNA invertase Pin-like site-specific DNA recombinase
VSRSQIQHAAFYGRTNARGINAVHIIAQQYEQCATAAARRVAITAFFYDLPQPIDEITELAVRGASGPLRRDGGWDALAASATGTDRPFDLILCASLDRIARKPAELEARCSLARRNKLAIVSAEELPDVLRPCSAWARRFTREIIINANGYGNHHIRDIGEPARRIRERKVRRRPAGSPPDTEPQ